jgi:hypothetical protein
MLHQRKQQMDNADTECWPKQLGRILLTRDDVATYSNKDVVPI